MPCDLLMYKTFPYKNRNFYKEIPDVVENMLEYKQDDIVNFAEDIIINAANGIGWMSNVISKIYKSRAIAENIIM